MLPQPSASAISPSQVEHDVADFRARYRATISPHYTPWLHGSFVLTYGLACIAFFSSRVEAPLRLRDWLALPMVLLLANWGEYTIHRHLGHHKTRLGRLFYKRHTGDHHSFFAEHAMQPDSPLDWRVILFPPWLIVLVSAGLALPAWALLQALSGNFAALFAGMLMGSYLLYEFTHACEHLPDSHVLARLPGIRTMRQLHALHHRHGLMRDHNLNIVFPLMDWLYGSLYREGQNGAAIMLGQTRMRHTIDVAASPMAVLEYASTATAWPQWHPSSLAVYATLGPLAAGCHFNEDIHAGGRRGKLRWQVIAHRPGEHWSAQAQGDHGLTLHLAYNCSPVHGDPTRTVFERKLDYRLPGLGWRLYNYLIARRRVERESRLSLQQLKHCIEQG